jgi:hypothetical protein
MAIESLVRKKYFSLVSKVNVLRLGVLAFGSDAQLPYSVIKCTTLLTCIENSYFS